MKTRLILFTSLLLAVISGCQNRKNYPYLQISGFAQGTTYHITYENNIDKNYAFAIDSILKAFDKSLSSYDSTSIISRINQNDPKVEVDDLFSTVFNKSREVFEISNGAFDITIGPVVNAWGFGSEPKMKVDSVVLDSLLQFVGMDKVALNGRKVTKKLPGVKLDVNAIAQGYSVDVVSAFFDREGVENYLVEIGGEIRTKGKNPSGKVWRIGIDKPMEGNDIPGAKMQSIIELKDKSLATSGNYRKFFEENGVKYAHSINPKTGYPVRDRLLSVTVVADDCMTADAFATTFMVIGLDKSKELLPKLKNIDAYFIFSGNDGSYQEYFYGKARDMIQHVETANQ